MSRNYRKLPLNVILGRILDIFPPGNQESLSVRLPGKFHFYRETLHWVHSTHHTQDHQQKLSLIRVILILYFEFKGLLRSELSNGFWNDKNVITIWQDVVKICQEIFLVYLDNILLKFTVKSSWSQNVSRLARTVKIMHMLLTCVKFHWDFTMCEMNSKTKSYFVKQNQGEKPWNIT